MSISMNSLSSNSDVDYPLKTFLVVFKLIFVLFAVFINRAYALQKLYTVRVTFWMSLSKLFAYGKKGFLSNRKKEATML